MADLYFKYYRDITRYDILFCILVLILTQRLLAAVILFGTFGTIISLMLYKYYQNIEYYFYLNGGLSKRGLILKTSKINAIISIILSIILWSIR